MLETGSSPGVVRKFICCRPSPWDLLTGFVQKSDYCFADFSRTKLLFFPDFLGHSVHLYVNKNMTKLASEC